MGKATALWRSGDKRDTQNRGATVSSCHKQEGLPGGECCHHGNHLLFPHGVMADPEMNPDLQFPAQGTVMTTFPFLL